MTGKTTLPNITLLRQFIEVADEKGIARAARKLQLSQPALSKNLRRLEETVGATLFERHSKGAALTPAGKALYRSSQIIIFEYEHALQEVQNSLSGQDELIRIGAGPLFTSTIIPASIPQFQRLYPKFSISVRSVPIEDLVNELMIGRIDLMAGALLEPVKAPGLTSRVVKKAELVLACGKDHPLARERKPIDLNELAHYPFVSFSPDSDLVQKLAQYLKKHGGPPPKYTVETSSIYGIVELLKNGEHIVVTSSMIFDYPIGVELAQIKTEHPIETFDLGLTYLSKLEKSAGFRAFLRILRQTMKSSPKTG